MKVYHVYEVFYEGMWSPDECSSRIFKNFDDACKYGNELAAEALANGETIDDYDDEGNTEFSKDCLALFFLGASEEDDHRIYIDEYELM